MDLCVTCKSVVEVDHRAMECDLREQWEHMCCVKECDRPSDDLYDALMKSIGSKAILYVCTRCRRKGSVAKRLLEKELELTRVTNDLARATDERLASTRQLELLSKELHELHAELVRLKGDNKSPSGEVKSLTKESKGKMMVTGVSRSVTAERELSIEPLLERSESSRG